MHDTSACQRAARHAGTETRSATQSREWVRTTADSRRVLSKMGSSVATRGCNGIRSILAGNGPISAASGLFTRQQSCLISCSCRQHCCILANAGNAWARASQPGEPVGRLRERLPKTDPPFTCHTNTSYSTRWYTYLWLTRSRPATWAVTGPLRLLALRASGRREYDAQTRATGRRRPRDGWRRGASRTLGWRSGG